MFFAARGNGYRAHVTPTGVLFMVGSTPARMRAGGRELRQHRPVASQNTGGAASPRRPVDSRYVLRNRREVTFEIAAHGFPGLGCITTDAERRADVFVAKIANQQD